MSRFFAVPVKVNGMGTFPVRAFGVTGALTGAAAVAGTVMASPQSARTTGFLPPTARHVQ